MALVQRLAQVWRPRVCRGRPRLNPLLHRPAPSGGLRFSLGTEPPLAAREIDHAGLKADKLRKGLQDMPPWVFASLAGTPLDHANVEKAFKRVLKAAELPLHYTPHCLRHTFASLLLQQGVSPVTCSASGHASIQLTVDTYGKWLPMGNKVAVDALDSPSGSKVVATAGQEAARASQVTDSSRATRRSRTGDR